MRICAINQSLPLLKSNKNIAKQQSFGMKFTPEQAKSILEFAKKIESDPQYFERAVVVGDKVTEGVKTVAKKVVKIARPQPRVPRIIPDNMPCTI